MLYAKTLEAARPHFDALNCCPIGAVFCHRGNFSVDVNLYYPEFYTIRLRVAGLGGGKVESWFKIARAYDDVVEDHFFEDRGAGFMGALEKARELDQRESCV